MKTTQSLIACLVVFVLFAAPGAGNGEPPTFRVNAEWIVISGINKEDGTLNVWTYAIRRTAVMSVRIAAEGGPADEGSPEKLQKLPAEIWITTNEITNEGSSKVYRVGGLTHAAASAMLDKIVEATGVPETSKVEEEDGEASRALRILAVGDAPPWEEIEIERDDGRGKARLQQEPAVGSVPPHQVSLVNREGAADGEPAILTLNEFSAVVAAPGGAVPLHESNPGGVKSKQWHSINYPPGTSAALAILWRDPEVKKWDKAQSLTLRDDITAFPAGMVRIVNVAGVEVSLDLDGKTSKLPHGEALLHPAKGGKTHLKANFEWREKRIVIANQQVSQEAGERAHVIIYLADGEAPRRPLKAIVLREVAQTPSIPGKRSP